MCDYVEYVCLVCDHLMQAMVSREFSCSYDNTLILNFFSQNIIMTPLSMPMLVLPHTHTHTHTHTQIVLYNNIHACM